MDRVWIKWQGPWPAALLTSSPGDSGVHLPSVRHLQNVHSRVDIERDPLRMSDNIVDSLRMEAEHLPFCERTQELTRFGGLQETTAAYVEAFRRLTEATGSVGTHEIRSQKSYLTTFSVLVVIAACGFSCCFL